MEEKRIQLSEKDIEGNFFNFQEIWERNKTLVILFLLGLILIGIGTFSLLLFRQKEPEIQVITEEAQKEKKKTIFVHLEGAVEKPGIYELPEESRTNDLLIQAGGLSLVADREWVSQNLNLAQKLVDGAKIYIPKIGEVKSQTTGAVLGSGNQKSGKININTASLSQLDSLWGIGEKRAQDIIQNRSYQSLEELVTKAKIPKNIYDKIKEEITLY